MGVEFTITKELANIGVTLSELISITSTVQREIRGKVFNDVFDRMVNELAKTYDVVIDNLTPLLDIETVDDFAAGFDQRYAKFRDEYLIEISKPRSYCDESYETYLELKTLRETKTKFPLLKRTFDRLDQFVEKWITNDEWLAMSVDTLFKMLYRLLTEISDTKAKDIEDAYLLYQSGREAFIAHLGLIADRQEVFDSLRVEHV
ncbi:hypothetical protein [Thiosocius teredinicola]|uniref:hypothetical protein n=1 Tax=Thiosocius teredinicola TaxID=1973002 RepID=UPI0009911E3F